ncbi:unnamed protein product [Enterobius vermicularis]|uniref:28S ribosomal protein S18b, mitochondrial n=1 Tax=Enterobius vermicularis TaxID=51028 RepID=A0A0N4V3X5_ENTVE|nr:unnamed protein product [Enterobius vermicularis]
MVHSKLGCYDGAFLSTTSKLRLPNNAQEIENAAEGEQNEVNEEIVEATGYAFNHVEKKKSLIKPEHTLAEQIAYMRSKAYQNAYKGKPVHAWYRRNYKGQAIFQPPPRLRCLDKDKKFRTNNACPICRDEYLFFDYRNPELIMQFLKSGTAEPLPLLQTGLCFEQYHNLRAQLLKAKEHGTIKFCVPFRNFDYKVWYSWWDGPEHVPVYRGSTGETLHRLYPDPLVIFPTHSRDFNNNWDQWWERYTFAVKGK